MFHHIVGSYIYSLTTAQAKWGISEPHFKITQNVLAYSLDSCVNSVSCHFSHHSNRKCHSLSWHFCKANVILYRQQTSQCKPLTQCFLAVSTAASGIGHWGAKPKVKIIKIPSLQLRKSTSNKTRASSLRVFKDGLICFGTYNIKIFTWMQVCTTALQVQEQMTNSLPKHKHWHSMLLPARIPWTPRRTYGIMSTRRFVQNFMVCILLSYLYTLCKPSPNAG